VVVALVVDVVALGVEVAAVVAFGAEVAAVVAFGVEVAAVVAFGVEVTAAVVALGVEVAAVVVLVPQPAHTATTIKTAKIVARYFFNFIHYSSLNESSLFGRCT
jgi:hypothetical protein